MQLYLHQLGLSLDWRALLRRHCLQQRFPMFRRSSFRLADVVCELQINPILR